MTGVLRDSLWPGLILWMLLYLSDECFTITCARMYRAQDTIVVEGSFELTPAFKKGVDVLRRVSPRFLLALGAGAALFVLLWWLGTRPPYWTDGYLYALGALVLLETAVHIRHPRNWHLFRTALGPDGVQGRLVYPRAIVLRASAFELRLFAGLYASLSLLSSRWFLPGGATSCLVTSLKQFRLATKHAVAGGSVAERNPQHG